MSESPPDPSSSASAGGHASGRLHTEAVERRGRWPGVVWAIPLAALLVVIYLAIQAVANHGVEVVVTFKTSGGARVGDTPVVYKGVTVGHVVQIQIARDARNVDMTLRMDPRAAPHLREGAKFWLIGAEPSLTDLSSLKAAVSGVSIGVSPGTGAPARRFIGLAQPPAVPPETAGTLYVLDGAQVGSTRVGSAVYYHGLPVGRVTRTLISDVQTLRLVIFINAPFDKLVRPGTLFFNANAADVAVSSGRLSASLGPGSSVITGGIEFDTPATVSNARQSPAHTTFHFYPTEAEATDQPHGPQVPYRAVFHAATQRPQAGAPVTLGGVRVGRVVDSRITLPPGATAPVTEVSLELEPESLNLPEQGDPKALMDTALRSLLRGGYRLQMGQFPPLIGAANLTFQRSGAAKGGLLSNERVAEIPTAGGSGVDELTSKMNTIMDKVNAVPIAAIGEDVRQITGRLSTLVSSPQLTDSLKHLDGTLTQVDQMMAEVKPQVGPLIAKMNQAADQVSGTAAAAKGVLGGEGGGQDATLPAAIRQLDEAARSIRSLADYLGRHPEALIKGKAKDSR